MKTIAKEWESFKTELIPRDAPVGQFRDMKIAFYGGVGATLAILLDSIKQKDKDKKKAVENTLTGMLAELTKFLDGTSKV